MTALAATGSIVACGLVFPTVLDGQGLADAANAVVVTDVVVTLDAKEAGPPPPPTCAGYQPPLPPAEDSNTGVTYSFLNAVRTIYYNVPPDAGPELGFNLDNTCTCEDGGPPSCISRFDGGIFRQCDDPGCRDVSGNSILTLFDSYFQGASAQGSINSQISAGALTVLFVVADYNGGPNDTSVVLTSFVSDGILGPDGKLVPPKWDGTDEWTVDVNTENGATNKYDGGWVYSPQFLSTSGYVTNGVLVATIPEFVVNLGFGQLDISTITVTGTLVPMSGSWGLEGQVVGRASTHGVLSLLANIADPFGGNSNLCGSDKTYRTIRQTLCEEADILKNPSFDNTGATCDAISIAVGITANPAKFGPPYMANHAPPGCDGGVDDCESP